MSEGKKMLQTLIKASLHDWIKEYSHKNEVSLKAMVEAWIEKMKVEEKGKTK